MLFLVVVFGFFLFFFFGKDVTEVMLCPPQCILSGGTGCQCVLNGEVNLLLGCQLYPMKSCDFPFCLGS